LVQPLEQTAPTDPGQPALPARRIHFHHFQCGVLWVINFFGALGIEKWSLLSQPENISNLELFVKWLIGYEKCLFNLCYNRYRLIKGHYVHE
jgi:hypothetical protein